MSKNEKSKKERLTPKEAFSIGAVALSFIAAAYEGGKNYGYHPNRNPSPPTYQETHQGINPADIVRSGTGK